MNNSNHILIVHLTCPSSRRVLSRLEHNKLINKITIIKAVNPWKPVVISNSFVWSVPWLISMDKGVLATDPLDPNEVIDIINGEYKGLDIDPLEAFARAIIYSGYASILVLLHESIDPVLDPVFIRAATRAPLTNINVEEVKKELVERSSELYEELYDVLVRIVAVAYTRTLYRASNGELDASSLRRYADPVNVSSWLLSSASIGRIALPGKPVSSGAVKDISSFIQRNAVGLLNKVRGEYSLK